MNKSEVHMGFFLNISKTQCCLSDSQPLSLPMWSLQAHPNSSTWLHILWFKTWKWVYELCQFCMQMHNKDFSTAKMVCTFQLNYSRILCSAARCHFWRGQRVNRDINVQHIIARWIHILVTTDPPCSTVHLWQRTYLFSSGGGYPKKLGGGGLGIYTTACALLEPWAALMWFAKHTDALAL